MDKDGSGQLTEQEFDELVENDEVLAHLASLGIAGCRMKGIFKLLDLDASGTLSVDEVVTGCLNIQSEAKAIDMLALLHDNKRMERMLQELRRAVEFQARVDSGGYKL